MRDVFTFTIDPADAKDFDDALSFQHLTGEAGLTSNSEAVYQIGVHIADVSHYVRPDTEIDDEAYKRGTSTYLVDRVIPMLPEYLSNDLCSLRPGEDKLCMSVIFTMTADAQVLKYKICRTVIRSDARLNYDEVQEMLVKHEALSYHSPGIYDIISRLNDLASKLRAERLANGALAIEQDEMRFKLDENKHPVDIYFEHPNEAHHLIEEFMLLANKTVAKAVGSGRPFVYRVHDLPDSEKLDDLKKFKKRMGARVQPQTIDLLTIRAQAKAVYSTYNIGHYGLAFSHYTHFTSPIRRYPDLMVHRLVERYILTGKKCTLTREELEAKCEHCSACEQEAAQAERDSVKLFQTIWLSDHVGEIFNGHITGVTDFGLFVQLDDSRCEGLVHISKVGFPGENWQFDEKNYRLICAENGITHTLGDAVRVKVTKTDINRSQIDFDFA
jgi:ribonuclease R